MVEMVEMYLPNRYTKTRQVKAVLRFGDFLQNRCVYCIYSVIHDFDFCHSPAKPSKARLGDTIIAKNK